MIFENVGERQGWESEGGLRGPGPQEEGKTRGAVMRGAGRRLFCFLFLSCLKPPKKENSRMASVPNIRANYSPLEAAYNPGYKQGEMH